jgi:signal transduction histidine kinase
MDTFPHAAELLLETRSPVVIATGPELRTVHNEAFALLMPDVGSPPGDGAPLRELSPELWERASPLIMQTMLGGQSSALSDQLFCLCRNGYADETYLTICCDPVFDGERAIVGTRITLAETTERVVGARRRRALREVAAAGADARSADDACHRVAEAMTRHSSDIPFALIYLVNAERTAARLAATAGLRPGAPASPLTVNLQSVRQDRGWPISAAFVAKSPLVVDDVLARFGSLPAGDWPFAPQRTIVAALTSPGRSQPDAVLIIGVSARHTLDEWYLDFTDLLTKHIAAAIAGGRLREEKERMAVSRAKRRARVRAMKERFAGMLEERTRLAREIHDTLLQGVTGISLNLQAVLPQLRSSPACAVEALERITELAIRTSREARLAVWDIRPQALNERELVRAVESAARLALGDATVTLRVSTIGRGRRLGADVQSVLLRVVQEAVANVVRHAGARTIRISLAFGEERLRLRIADDGRGFIVKRDFRSYSGHWGLVGMRERAEQIGALFSIRSAPGRGTAITLDVPLAARKSGQAA